ncbi:MAG: hypothetical protein ACH346_04120, partial [Chthoniobacterales bacterium]
MKKPTLRKILFLCLLAPNVLLSRVWAQALATASTHEVTASEYCNFLNHIAPSDAIPAAEIHDNVELNPVYDEHMAFDPVASCIARLGAPGRWHYEVIVGRENFPITFVSEQTALNYCTWKNSTLAVTVNTDPSLKSNRNAFSVETTDAPSLSMMAPEVVASGSEVAEIIEGVAAGIGSLLLGGRVGHVMEDGVDHTSTFEHQPVEVETSLTLHDFRTAAVAHPEVSQWMINPEGKLQPSDEPGVTAHLMVVAKLEQLLKKNYSPTIAEKLLLSMGHQEASGEPLSSLQLYGMSTQLDHIEEKRGVIKNFFYHFIGEQQKFLYDAANREWNVASRAWRDQMNWERAVNSRKREYATAEQLLKAAEEERAKINPEETKLGIAARLLERAGPVLDKVGSLIPLPVPAGTAAETLAKVLKAINEYAVNGDLNKAQEAFDSIEEEKERAIKQEAEVREEAHRRDIAASAVEKKVRKAHEQAIKNLAEQIKPPSNSLNPSVWESWKNFLGAEEMKHHLMEHGMDDSRWINDLVADAWQEGTRLLKGKLNAFKAEKNFPEEIAQEKELHRKARQAAENIAALKAQEQEAQEAMEQTMRIKLQAQQDYKKNKSTNNHNKLRRAEALHQRNEEHFFQLHQELIETESGAGPLLEQQKFLREAMRRNIERTQIELSTWKAVWKSFFPEEQKMNFLISSEQKEQEKIAPPLIYSSAAERLARKFTQESEAVTESTSMMSSRLTPESAAEKNSLEKKEHGYYRVPEMIEIIGEDNKERLEAWTQVQQIMTAQRRAKRDEKIQQEDDESASISEATETASTVSGFSQAVGSFKRKQNFAKASLHEAYADWQRLVCQKTEQIESNFEKDRIDWKSWQALDQELLDHRKEEKRTERAALLQAKMANESLRWEAFAQAKMAEEALGKLKVAAQKEDERLALSLQTLSLPQAETLQQAAEEPAMSSMSLEEANEKVTNAWVLWDELAEQHPSIAILEGADPAVIKAAKAKLKEADEAAHEIKAREALKAIVQSNREVVKKEAEDQYEPSTTSSIEKPSRSRRYAINEYQRNLLAQKGEALNRFYEELTTTSAEEALFHYQEKMEQAALEGARSNSLVARQGWQKLVERSFEIFKREIEGMSTHARPIAEVDWRALQIFKGELERVNYIKEKLKVDQEEGERRLKRARDLAAERYFEGDPDDWYHLLPEQRATYNQDVEAANEIYAHSEFEDALPEVAQVQETERQLILARQQVEQVKSKFYLFQTSKQEDLKPAEESLAGAELTWNEAKQALKTAKEKQEKQKSFQAAAQRSFIASGEMRLQRPLPSDSDFIEELREAAAKAFQEAGVRFEESAEALKLNQPEFIFLRSEHQPEFISLHQSVTAAFHQAGELYSQSVEEHLAQRSESAKRYYEQAASYNDVAEKFRDALKKVKKFSMDERLDQLRRDKVRCNQNAAQAKASGDEVETAKWYEAAKAFHWYETATALQDAKWNLMSGVEDDDGYVAIFLERAAEAFKKGNSEKVAFLTQHARLKAQVTEYHIQEANAYAQGNAVEAAKWNNVATATTYAYYGDVADLIDKAAEASKAGRSAEATFWNQYARLQQQAVEHYLQAANAYAQGNDDIEAAKWANIASALQNVRAQSYNLGDFIDKAAEAFKAGRSEEATFWNQY